MEGSTAVLWGVCTAQSLGMPEGRNVRTFVFSHDCGSSWHLPTQRRLVPMFRLHGATARAAARRASSTHRSPPAVTHIDSWIRKHEASFAPPVMNKLLHRDQLSIMFVGGPNEREDFHLEEGSEFFYQLRGNMQLPTVQAGQRTVVTIREGEVYLLPSRIPHSPQRPERGSIGLVIERQRYEHEPPDGLRFYTDFKGVSRVPRPGESPLATAPKTGRPRAP